MNISCQDASLNVLNMYNNNDNNNDDEILLDCKLASVLSIDKGIIYYS